MRTRLVTVLLALITAFVVIPGPAATADEQGGESLTGQIGQPDDRSQGVEGIRITVSDGDDEVGADETDPDGNWEVEVPGSGTFHLEVDHWEEDIARERSLVSAVRVVIRCTARELRDDPDRLAADLRRLGVPPRAPQRVA